MFETLENRMLFSGSVTGTMHRPTFTPVNIEREVEVGDQNVSRPRIEAAPDTAEYQVSSEQ